MKLIDYILISVAVGFFIIGLDQLFKNMLGSYWIFMMSVICLLILNYRKFLQTKASEDTKSMIPTKNLSKTKKANTHLKRK